MRQAAGSAASGNGFCRYEERTRCRNIFRCRNRIRTGREVARLCGLPFFGRNSAARSYSPVRAPSVSDVPDRISVVSRTVVGRLVRAACGGGSAVSRFFVHTSKDTVGPASMRRVFWGNVRSVLFAKHVPLSSVPDERNVARSGSTRPSDARIVPRLRGLSAASGTGVPKPVLRPFRAFLRRADILPAAGFPGTLRARRRPGPVFFEGVDVRAPVAVGRIRILRRIPETGSRRGGSPEAAAQCSSRKKSTIRRQAAPSP